MPSIDSNRPKAKRKVTFREDESPKQTAETVPMSRNKTAKQSDKSDKKQRGWKKRPSHHDEERAYIRDSFMNSFVSENSDRRTSSHSFSSIDSESSFNSYYSRQEPRNTPANKHGKNCSHRRSSFQKVRTSFRKMVPGSATDKPCVHYLILIVISMVVAIAFVLSGAFVYDKVFKNETDSASLSSNNEIASFPSQAPSVDILNTYQPTPFSQSSKPPSSSPLTPSNVGACRNNQTFIFILFNGNLQPCEWFNHDKKSEARKRRYCVNETISSNCCESCEGFVLDDMFPSSSPLNIPSLLPSSFTSNAPSGTPSHFLSSSPPTYLDTCINNQTFVFNLLNGNEQPCSWFNHPNNTEEEKHNYCVNETVKSNCCESCEGIPYLDMVPSLSPSTSPTVINGTRPSSSPTIIN
jgi:hypothetical protein